MDVKELVSRLEALTLTKDDFHHRQHLEVAFWYLQSKGSKAGSNAIVRAIGAFTTHLGHASKFHATITLCWVRLVAAGMAEEKPCTTPDELIARHPALLDKHLPLRFYSKEVLFSDKARTQWVEPDIEPLPPVVIASTNA
jgi:hypothetical protein